MMEWKFPGNMHIVSEMLMQRFKRSFAYQKTGLPDCMTDESVRNILFHNFVAWGTTMCIWTPNMHMTKENVFKQVNHKHTPFVY